MLTSVQDAPQPQPRSEHSMHVEQLPLKHLALGTHSGGGGGGGGAAAAAIAYRHLLPSEPGSEGPPTPPRVCVLFCNGLKSDMTGAKVRHVLRLAAAAGAEFVCFDYPGHGASRGPPFERCGLQDWLEAAQALLEHVVVARRVVVVGSSIGGWVALRLAQSQAQEQEQDRDDGSGAERSPAARERERRRDDQPRPLQQPATDGGSAPSLAAAAARHGPEPHTLPRSDPAAPIAGRCPRAHIVGLLLVAPAVDITEVRWAALSPTEQQHVLSGGAASLDSPYTLPGGDAVQLPYFAQGRRHLLLCPEARQQPLVAGVAHLGPLAEVKTAAAVAAAAEGRDDAREAWHLAPPPPPVCVPCPVRILAGGADEVVPLTHVALLARAISAAAEAAAAAAAAGAGGGASTLGVTAGISAAPPAGAFITAATPEACAVAAPAVGAHEVGSGGGGGCRHADAAVGLRVHEVVGGGDHRLSCEAGLAALGRQLGALLALAGA